MITVTLDAGLERLELDSLGIQAILYDPEMWAALREAGGYALAHAQAIAPVESGRYLRSLHVERGTYLAQRGPRPAAEVVADVPYAEAVEEDHHVIGRTLAFLGGSGFGVRL